VPWAKVGRSLLLPASRLEERAGGQRAGGGGGRPRSAAASASAGQPKALPSWWPIEGGRPRTRWRKRRTRARAHVGRTRRVETRAKGPAAADDDLADDGGRCDRRGRTWVSTVRKAEVGEPAEDDDDDDDDGEEGSEGRPKKVEVVDVRGETGSGRCAVDETAAVESGRARGEAEREMAGMLGEEGSERGRESEGRPTTTLQAKADEAAEERASGFRVWREPGRASSRSRDDRSMRGGRADPRPTGFGRSDATDAAHAPSTAGPPDQQHGSPVRSLARSVVQPRRLTPEPTLLLPGGSRSSSTPARRRGRRPRLSRWPGDRSPPPPAGRSTRRRPTRRGSTESSLSSPIAATTMTTTIGAVGSRRAGAMPAPVAAAASRDDDRRRRQLLVDRR
jgi:hypothetical protein